MSSRPGSSLLDIKVVIGSMVLVLFALMIVGFCFWAAVSHDLWTMLVPAGFNLLGLGFVVAALRRFARDRSGLLLMLAAIGCILWSMYLALDVYNRHVAQELGT